MFDFVRIAHHVPRLSFFARCKANENFASTISRDHALFDADASRSYPAFSLQGLRSNAQSRPLADAKRQFVQIRANLSKATVNRKVDGTFTDLTPITGSLG
ncbi:hypothetical protein PUN4_270032 [Paraburkholderia unamae]|nr:hypothetical protein PUN4_270032 [Paraburkholderia unamae]